MNSVWLGQIPYLDALNLQNQWQQEVLNGHPGVVLFCEHPSVITLGKRGKIEEDLNFPLSKLQESGISVVNIDRGGQAVMHNPGQLVVYPILPIRRLDLGVRNYVDLLEKVTQEFLENFGLNVFRSVEPGLWVGEKKIAYFGIRIKNGVSMHGLCINIKNNLEELNTIKQCGLNINATHLENETRKKFDKKELAKTWLKLFESRIVEFAAKTSLSGISTAYLGRS